MRVTLNHPRASSILHDGKFYDTKRPIELPFSEALRLSRVAEVKAVFDTAQYDPLLWKKNKFINFFGDIDGISGFGGVSKALIRYSAAHGVENAVVGKMFGVRDPKILEALKRPLNQHGAMIWHDQPRDSWLHTPFKKNIAILPFETTRIPRSWNAKLALFEAIFTPCKQNIQMFRDSGITIPIELIHWGVDKNSFYPVERDTNRPFTFGHMGALSTRKGTDILVEAFREAFPKQTDVRLICKTSHPTYRFGVPDARIHVHMEHWTHDELMEQFFKQIDCFAFPTRGEGFGLTPLEAMATGVAAIVTGWSGPLEYMTPDVGWLIDYKMTYAKSFADTVYKEDCGDWAEPSKAHLVELMRHAYHNRDEVKAKGAAAAKYVQENWLWENKIQLYLDALNKHL
jgi:glycosyltransferase involved in cell wall biosynthesis